ncbi:hypothetical protein FRB96_005300 [Tulasnella sp. 330]|nr:hypothetical protein FRB96_005300 [Tulasnella sp. 330]
MSVNNNESIKREWTTALDSLPSVSDGRSKIPAFYFAHGSPMLLRELKAAKGPMDGIMKSHGPRSPLALFLSDFGPALLQKYNPKAIVIFSAHWETKEETLVTDYGDSNPLLFDYYGFEREAGISARTTRKEESRGRDGRGFMGPGLDHGVFVPFKLMFGDSVDVPVIQVSIDGSLAPEKNWALGKALNALRSEGILILSGGLTIHTFKDPTAWSESTANARVRGFSSAILDAVRSPSDALQASLYALTKHSAFREAHPREEHFIPIYVAAGAGEDGAAKIISSQHGAPTFAFGV